MTWRTNVPRGDLLPATERPRFSDNWNYIENTLQHNHYWDESNEGIHRRVDLPNLEADTDSSLTLDTRGDPNSLPTISGATINGIFYARSKTATEAPNGQFTEPYFFKNDSGTGYALQFGVRVMGTFRVSGGSIVSVSGNKWDYQHNVSDITRSSTGRFTVTIRNNLPNARYVVLSTAEASGSGVLTFLTSKAVGSFGIGVNVVSNNSPTDPASLSFVVMGG